MTEASWKLNWSEPRFCSNPDEIVADLGVFTLLGINKNEEEDEELLLMEVATSLQRRIEGLSVLDMQYRSTHTYLTVSQDEIIFGEIGVFKGNSWIYIKCHNEGFLQAAHDTLYESKIFNSIHVIQHEEQVLLKRQRYYVTVRSGGNVLGTLFQVKLFGIRVVAQGLISYAVDDGPTLELIESSWKGQGLGSLLLKTMEEYFTLKFPCRKFYIDHAKNQTAKEWYKHRGFQEYSATDGEERMYKVLNQLAEPISFGLGIQ